jgi:queuine tRNA-ribosyltransferase/7-cyano-7-deazaguanine tRNA-ribosyltransferase
MLPEFKIIKKTNSRGRVGVFKNHFGNEIETPCYVTVGTNAKVRTLESADLIAVKTSAIISNTFHLWRGTEGITFPEIKERGGLHKVMGFDGLIMTDSGGFQVFSMGIAREHGVGKVAPQIPGHRDFGEDTYSPEKNTVKITDEGAWFKENGEDVFLGPKESIQIQEELGADIILAFDEPTSPFHDKKYTEEAMQRTHRWAKLCLDYKTRNDQLLYGIVQGGTFQDLRKLSSEFIGGLSFGGFAIGGSFSESFGDSREETFQVLEWTVPYLPEDKPRHLLGIGRPEDILDAVEFGIDTFDCVIPTREARHGAAWTKYGRIDMTKSINKEDNSKLEDDCVCPTCENGINKKEIFRLIKLKNASAAKYLTIHNLWFFNNFMRQIREAMKNDFFDEFKKLFLETYRN